MAPKAKPIRAYHGSPHNFDRFDASKIGTGEGAQAYGHGLYFAGSEDTADFYRRKLSEDGDAPEKWARDYWAAQAQPDSFGSPEEAYDYLLRYIRSIRNAGPGSSYSPGLKKHYAAAEKWLLSQNPYAVPAPIRQGHMYEVEIGHPEESLLDWDKPIYGQSDAVIDGLKRLNARALGAETELLDGAFGGLVWRTPRGNIVGTPTRNAAPETLSFWDTHQNHRHGGGAISDLNALKQSPTAASEALRSVGIPGVRYLDQGSRAAGEGTRNFVMFPGTEDLIRIVRKYGWIPPAMYAAGQAGTASAQESPAGSGEGTAGPPSPEQEFWSRMDAIAKSRGEEMLNLQRRDIFRRLGNNNLQFAKDPARGEFFERINPLAGRDFSTSISPLEWQRWYEQPEQGYGGPEHKSLIANMEQAMDIPAIPEGYVRQQLGEDFATAFPEHAGGDLTMRQYMAAMPAIMGINKKREFWAAMRNRDVDAVRKAGEEIRLLDRQQQIKGQPGGERYSDLVSDVFANLTGQVYPRGEQNKLAQDGATMLLDALKSGTPGGEFEDAPEWTREQYEQLKQQYGDEADRMLPKGGEKNHKRLAVYELASAMQDGPHAPAGVSTYATAQNFLAGSFGTPGMGASQRFYDLTDYAPRGRANIANERWGKTGLLRDKPTDRPYAVRGEEFGATDPKGWEGMVANTHNASFPMGAAVAPLMGVTTNPGSYAQLAMEKGPIRAAQFLGQTAGNLERLAPIRDGKQSQGDFNQQREWWQDWNQAKGGWISSRLGPAMQEVHGHKRQFLPVWADAVANTPSEILGSPYELGATVAAAGLGGVRRLAANTMAEIGEEAAENLTYGPILGASQTGSLKESADQLMQIPKQNAYLLPRQDGTAVKADDKDYWEQLERSRQHHIRQLRDAYNRWDNSQPGRVRETGFGVVPQPNAG